MPVQKIRPSQARVTNHQRVGSISNAHAGREFEAHAATYFAEVEGLVLQPSFLIALGHGSETKKHRFDLGSGDPAILVECKSHNWRESGNMPSAKITVWNEAMYYFHLAPAHYRKVLFVTESNHARRTQSLAAHYFRNHRHLIPAGVSIIEYNPESKVVLNVTAAP
jgi:hypothetical protein